jgi:hypothetical protein
LGNLFNGAAQTFHYGLQFRRGTAASRGFPFPMAGRAGLGHPLLALLPHLDEFRF